MSTDESYQAAFERIESAVDAGQTDLGLLGFWRLLAKVKAEPMLAAHWAEAAGRIDRKVFEARVRWRLPVWMGNAVLVLGILVGSFAVGLAMGTRSALLAGLALVFAGGAWMICLHDLAHWLTGRIAGIRFTAYFLSGPYPPFLLPGPFPPRPGLKSDYATYLRAAPGARAWMHASGAIATKAAPFVVLAFWPATGAPAWVAWTLAGLGALSIATDLLFSRTRSDWKKVRRELAIARIHSASR
ncbi:MAG TPA: hypothetical protein VE669_02120 [Actinomycetota bacterium]|nr:hypothetical protein [Actinomycetota bacterium]